jgi:hypothetical protein
MVSIVVQSVGYCNRLIFHAPFVLRCLLEADVSLLGLCLAQSSMRDPNPLTQYYLVRKGVSLT